MIAKPESLENAGLSSTDHGGGKRRGFIPADTLNHGVSRTSIADEMREEHRRRVLGE